MFGSLTFPAFVKSSIRGTTRRSFNRGFRQLRLPTPDGILEIALAHSSLGR